MSSTCAPLRTNCASETCGSEICEFLLKRVSDTARDGKRNCQLAPPPISRPSRPHGELYRECTEWSNVSALPYYCSKCAHADEVLNQVSTRPSGTKEIASAVLDVLDKAFDLRTAIQWCLPTLRKERTVLLIAPIEVFAHPSASSLISLCKAKISKSRTARISSSDAPGSSPGPHCSPLQTSGSL